MPLGACRGVSATHATLTQGTPRCQNDVYHLGARCPKCCSHWAMGIALSGRAAACEVEVPKHHQQRTARSAPSGRCGVHSTGPLRFACDGGERTEGGGRDQGPSRECRVGCMSCLSPGSVKGFVRPNAFSPLYCQQHVRHHLPWQLTVHHMIRL